MRGTETDVRYRRLRQGRLVLACRGERTRDRAALGWREGHCRRLRREVVGDVEIEDVYAVSRGNSRLLLAAEAFQDVGGQLG